MPHVGPHVRKNLFPTGWGCCRKTVLRCQSLWGWLQRKNTAPLKPCRHPGSPHPRSEQRGRWRTCTLTTWSVSESSTQLQSCCGFGQVLRWHFISAQFLLPNRAFFPSLHKYQSLNYSLINTVSANPHLRVNFTRKPTYNKQKNALGKRQNFYKKIKLWFFVVSA